MPLSQAAISAHSVVCGSGGRRYAGLACAARPPPTPPLQPPAASSCTHTHTHTHTPGTSCPAHHLCCSLLLLPSLEVPLQPAPHRPMLPPVQPHPWPFFLHEGLRLCHPLHAPLCDEDGCQHGGAAAVPVGAVHQHRPPCCLLLQGPLHPLLNLRKGGRVGVPAGGGRGGGAHRGGCRRRERGCRVAAWCKVRELACGGDVWPAPWQECWHRRQPAVRTDHVCTQQERACMCDVRACPPHTFSCSPPPIMPKPPRHPHPHPGAPPSALTRPAAPCRRGGSAAGAARM